MRRIWGRGLSRALAAGLLAGTALPALAQPLTGDGSITCGGSYTIASGDTLSEISDRAFGTSKMYGAIVDANPALGGNPENIAVGETLTIPCLDISGQVMTAEQTAAAAAGMQAAIAAEGPLTADELDTLFGPVALFPDELLTPVLVAVTFPLDVVKAGRFVAENAAATDKERADKAATESWDESVRELAAGFPAVVTRMSDNIDWTEQAGEAVVAQTDDVLASVQRLRTKAQENGYLVSNQAQTVTEEDDKIVIQAATPNVVYVPTYDPQVVYTTPVVGEPVYHYGYDYDDDWDDWDNVLVGGGIILGTAIVLDEIFDDDDWRDWRNNDDIDWDRGDITIDRGDIDIDRDINIDRDNINIGGGDRTRIGDGQIGQGNLGDRVGDGQLGDRVGDGQLGDGSRISIGDSDRTQVDRDALAQARERAGNGEGINREALAGAAVGAGAVAGLGQFAGDGPRAGTLPANRASVSNPASREAARQKIETRKATGAGPANLPANRPQASRPGSSRASGVAPSRPQASRPSAGSRPANVSRPSTSRPPTARASSRPTSSFSRPSGGHRAGAAASRGHGSMGSRGGGGRRR